MSNKSLSPQLRPSQASSRRATADQQQARVVQSRTLVRLDEKDAQAWFDNPKKKSLRIHKNDPGVPYLEMLFREGKVTREDDGDYYIYYKKVQLKRRRIPSRAYSEPYREDASEKIQSISKKPTSPPMSKNTPAPPSGRTEGKRELTISVSQKVYKLLVIKATLNNQQDVKQYAAKILEEHVNEGNK